MGELTFKKHSINTLCEIGSHPRRPPPLSPPRLWTISHRVCRVQPRRTTAHYHPPHHAAFSVAIFSASSKPCFAVQIPNVHTRVLEGIVKSQSPLKVLGFKSQQPCLHTVSPDLEPLLHSGVGRVSRQNTQYFVV